MEFERNAQDEFAPIIGNAVYNATQAIADMVADATRDLRNETQSEMIMRRIRNERMRSNKPRFLQEAEADEGAADGSNDSCTDCIVYEAPLKWDACMMDNNDASCRDICYMGWSDSWFYDEEITDACFQISDASLQP